MTKVYVASGATTADWEAEMDDPSYNEDLETFACPRLMGVWPDPESALNAAKEELQEQVDEWREPGDPEAVWHDDEPKRPAYGRAHWISRLMEERLVVAVAIVQELEVQPIKS